MTPREVDLSALAAKHPDWWKAHQRFAGDPNQRLDPWCPICRALIESGKLERRKENK